MKFLLFLVLGLYAIGAHSQQKHGKMTNKQTVEKFLNGFNDPSKIQESLNLLAEDYQFTNPMVKLNSKTEFIALAQEIGAVLTGVSIINIASSGDWVATYYKFTSSIKEVDTNMASEWFRVENGLIQESHLIYDASKWRKVYEQLEKK